MSLLVWACVVLIGGAGSVVRFLADGVVASTAGRDLPLGSLAVNVSGSVLLGLITGLALGHDQALLAGTAAHAYVAAIMRARQRRKRVGGSLFSVFLRLEDDDRHADSIDRRQPVRTDETGCPRHQVQSQARQRRTSRLWILDADGGYHRMHGPSLPAPGGRVNGRTGPCLPAAQGTGQGDGGTRVIPIDVSGPLAVELIMSGNDRFSTGTGSDRCLNVRWSGRLARVGRGFRL